MTKPKDDGVKRYYAEQITLSTYEVYEEKVDGLSDDYIEFVRAADHDREVGNLIYELSSANATITELEDLIDIKNDAISNMQIELHSLETELATARKVIAKLREQRNNYIQYTPLSSDLAQHLDAEIEAIEKGKP